MNWFIFPSLLSVLMTASVSLAQLENYQCKYPQYAIDIPGPVPQGKIALTFDDGPEPFLTPMVLDILKKYNIKATFFLVGSNITGNEKLVERELIEGHNIGNHTFNHLHLPTLTDAKIKTEFVRTESLLNKFPNPRAKLARFPYGASNCSAENTAEGMGYTIVGWHVDSCDWDYGQGLLTDCIDTPELKAKFKDDYHGWIDYQLNKTGGGVILMHDIQMFTKNHLEALIVHLKQEGYQFVSLDDGSFPDLVHSP